MPADVGGKVVIDTCNPFPSRDGTPAVRSWKSEHPRARWGPKAIA